MLMGRTGDMIEYETCTMNLGGKEYEVIHFELLGDTMNALIKTKCGKQFELKNVWPKSCSVGPFGETDDLVDENMTIKYDNIKEVDK